MTGRRNLPLGWTWAHFDDVASIESDLVDPTSHPDAPHIAPNHIESKTGGLLPYATVAADKVTSPKHRFRAGQILYSKIRPYLAKAVLVEFEGLCSADMYPVSTSLEPRFLLRWLLSDEFTARVSLDQGRTVLPKVNQAALGKIDVPVPPLNEQRRIVAKLEALLARSRRAKEALDAIPALLERFRQSVLAAAFRGDLTRDWRAANPDVEPASKLLERIRSERRRRWEEAELERMRVKGKVPKDSHWKEKYKEPDCIQIDGLPRLPSGWAWASVLQLGLVESGQTPKGIEGRLVTSGEIPWFRVGDMNTPGNEEVMVSSGASISPGDAARLGLHVRPAGAIIFPKRGGAIATNKKRRLSKPSCYDLNIMGVTPVEPLGPFLWWWFQQLDLARLGDGSNIPQINHGDIEPLPVPVPPLEEQRVLVARLGAQFAMLSRLESAYGEGQRMLRDLDSSSLAKAFRGELVPQDPADEPASVLLQRIRAERDKPADIKTNPRPKRRRDTKVA